MAESVVEFPLALLNVEHTLTRFNVTPRWKDDEILNKSIKPKWFDMQLICNDSVFLIYDSHLCC